jgi:WhiB family redox-sensing transcriptional regulator
MGRALCANTPGLTDEAFFPERGESTREAKAICRQCPVRDQCLEYGLGEHFGIWGGTSGRERQRIRRQRRQQRRAA